MEKKDGYMPGVDLAKLLVMYFIIAAHLIGYGLHPASGAEPSLFQKSLFGFLYANFATMNVFAIATGYLCINSSGRYSRLLPLWLQMVFTGLVMSLFLKTTGLAEISLSELSTTFRPVSNNSWWYMTAYFPLALLIPYLNVGLRQMPRRAIEITLVLTLGIVCTLDFCTTLGCAPVMRGYSFFWLLLLYVLGAYLRLYEPLRGLSPKRCLAGILVFSALSGVLPAVLSASKVPLLAKIGSQFHFFDLTAPAILAIGVLLFTLCCNLRITSPRAIRIVRALAPATLGVYLIHVQPFFWHRVFLPEIAKITVPSTWLYPVFCFGLAGLVFTVCLALDLLRVRLFRLLRVSELSERLCARVESLVFSSRADNNGTTQEKIP